MENLTRPVPIFAFEKSVPLCYLIMSTHWKISLKCRPLTFLIISLFGLTV